MLLPDQFGVYEQEHNLRDFNVPNTPEDDAEVALLMPFYHAGKDYSEMIKLVNNGSVKTQRGVWFVRNLALDSIKFYYRILTENTFQERKLDTKNIAKQSYDALKSESFLNILKEQKLELTKEIMDAVEETYNAALKLDK